MSRRKHAVWGILVAILLGLTALVGSEAASAHHRVDWKHWYFGSFTHSSTAGTRASRVNPLNIVFWSAQGQFAFSNLWLHLRSEWEHPFYELHRSFNTHGCLWIGPLQHVVFKALNDYKAGTTNPDWDEVDVQFSDNEYCFTQNHLRLWDDVEHNAHTNDHPVLNNWWIGNMHHERWVFGSDWHRLDENYERPARRLIGKLSEHCSYYKWRRLVGTKGLVGRPLKWSDGYLSIILWRHVDDPGACPRRP